MLSARQAFNYESIRKPSEGTRMTRFRIAASVSILFLTLGASAFGNAQDNKDNKNKQSNQDNRDKSKDKQQNLDKHDQDKHAKAASPANSANQPQGQKAGQVIARPQTPGDNGRHIGQQKQMERSPEQEHDQQRKQQSAWQERRANHWEYERRSWQQRGGYNGFRVPDDYYRDHYGDGHAFRIYSLPFLYEGGNARFQYGGYWFTMLDPCPENWGGRWYETDDVYVAYKGDGYYLFNRRYPGPIGIAVSVSL